MTIVSSERYAVLPNKRINREITLSLLKTIPFIPEVQLSPVVAFWVVLPMFGVRSWVQVQVEATFVG
jgi:hypothetical protein